MTENLSRGEQAIKHRIHGLTWKQIGVEVGSHEDPAVPVSASRARGMAVDAFRKMAREVAFDVVFPADLDGQDRARAVRVKVMSLAGALRHPDVDSFMQQLDAQVIKWFKEYTRAEEEAEQEEAADAAAAT